MCYKQDRINFPCFCLACSMFILSFHERTEGIQPQDHSPEKQMFVNYRTVDSCVNSTASPSPSPSGSYGL